MKLVIPFALNRNDKHRVINNYLTVLVTLFAFYIILGPFIPAFNWWVREETPLSGWVGVQSSIEQESTEVVKENKLFIPGAGVESQIFTGGSEQLSKGIMHKQGSGEPSSSNMVLAGHRFTYEGDGVFYHLDKINIGDDVILHWEGQSYKYTVTESLVVPANEVSIENPSDEHYLTIYTCTPLWTAKDRLVIKATPTGANL